MRPFEWLACAGSAALALAALAARASAARKLSVAFVSVSVAVGIAAAALHADLWWRQWVPHLYLVIGYWLPALLVPSVTAPSRFERWLVRSDEVLRARLPGLPAVLRPIVELAYLSCYPLVPLSFAVVWTRGTAADADRFWLIVLTSAFACYGALPWLVSRPPRLLQEHAPAPSRPAALNAFVLGRVSHRMNTFPSGHVAVSCAAAAAVLPVAPLPGVLLGISAGAVAVGAAAGRYHYVMDVVAGLAVVALVCVAAGLIG